MSLVVIDDLHVSVDGKEILKGISIEIKHGEVHAIMGPNGTGKSTLSYTISGRNGYEVTKGSILVNGKNILDMDVHERSLMGIFHAFQYPIEIPGVTTSNFLKSTINARRRYQGLEDIDAVEFLKLINEKMKLLNMDPDIIKRPLNVAFSGGEKKRAEILQMSVLEPIFGILDETDSGLDIDALKIVSGGINSLINDTRCFLLITHYQRLLNYVIPDYVHVLIDGCIVETGDKSLPDILEAEGYSRFELKA